MTLDASILELNERSQDFESLTAGDIIAWAVEKFNARIALACSFQAEESVLIDLLHRVRGSDFRIFTLDTGRLNQETYDCMDALRERYRVGIEVYFPDAVKVQDVVRRHDSICFTTRWICANYAVAFAKWNRSTAL
ncbi:MAG TPA: phosphoadenosine phosphosulfate reductase family protein [Candidatus Binatia bacterium]|nr:phosphoadenosine phosphosulfate reductase family protein [Candidatus Binatia bacterium]